MSRSIHQNVCTSRRPPPFCAPLPLNSLRYLMFYVVIFQRGIEKGGRWLAVWHWADCWCRSSVFPACVGRVGRVHQECRYSVAVSRQQPSSPALLHGSMRADDVVCRLRPADRQRAASMRLPRPPDLPQRLVQSRHQTLLDDDRPQYALTLLFRSGDVPRSRCI